VLFPKFPIAFARCLDIPKPLGNQFIWRKSIEPQTSLYGLVEIPIVRSVAKHAGCHDKFKIVAIGVTLGQQVIPRQRKPVRERDRTVKPAVTAFEIVAIVNRKCVAA
jgi:hypothetical protein